MYEALDVTLRQQNKSILSQVSLTVLPGRFTAVIGPNGAGKSSLLKVLSLEQPVHSGHVLLNGLAAKQYPALALSRLRAVMAQHTFLPFAFTAREVVCLGRHPHRTRAADNSRIVNEVMAATALEPLAHQNYLTLSGGEKQRVQLARVLAQVWVETDQPRYVLLDEPTSSMDIAQQQAMMQMVKNICARNIGVLAVLHDLNLAAQFADELYLLKNGNVIDHGPTALVFTEQNLERTFNCAVTVRHDHQMKHPFVLPYAEQLTTPSSIIHKIYAT